MKRLALPVCVLLLVGSAALAQSPPMDDLLWASSNSATIAVDRFGRIVHRIPVPTLSTSRAPDGTVWTLDSSGGVQRRDRQGNVLAAIHTGGTNRAMTFDAGGDAWVVIDGPPTLRRYSPAGALLRSVALPGPPLDVEVDARGLLWVIQVAQPSSLVSILDPRTWSMSTLALPPSFGVARDIETTPSGTALIGSASTRQLVEVDTNLGVRRSVAFRNAGVGPIALRAQGDAIVVAGFLLHRLDLASGRATVIDFSGNAYHSVGLDALGGVWAGNGDRLTRFDADLRREEIGVLPGAPPRVGDAAGYHRALVVAPNADDDGDGLANAVELQLGTNPYDAQSDANASLHTDRLTWRPLDRMTFELRGTGGQGVLLLATGTLRGQPVIPGFAGALRLDPRLTLPVAYPSVVPGRIELSVPDDPNLAGVTLFAQAVSGFFPPTFTDEAGARIERPATRTITETFQDELGLERDRSSGTWAAGVATPGPVGGSGALGDFDHRLGQSIGAGTFVWNTDDFTIPGSHTLSGLPVRVTDGRFEFGRFVVPIGVMVRFVGSRPATILVSGTCQIDGVLDLDGALVRGDHDGRNATVSGSVVVPGPGQAGGAAGAGGGTGGDGAWSCDGTGNPGQPQFNGFAGFDGDDVQVPATHAYAAATISTGGRGGTLFPPHGDDTLLVYRAFGSVYAMESAAGGGGGGFRAAGANGVCNFAGAITGFPPFPNTNPAERGPPSPGGIAFALFPLPPATTSREHFAVGGSGGGGGGSHPLFALRSNLSDPVKYRSGGAGAGGGGAIALRIGHRLDVAAGGSIRARGGSAEPTAVPTSVALRGVPVPGGGGSGGSVLLQVGGAVGQAGTLDVRGGDGSETSLGGFFHCDTRGGDGADGSLRLEVAQPNPPVSLLGATLPAAGPNDVGTLLDRDPIVVQLSAGYPISSAGSATELLHYEIDVNVGGVTQTYTDDPAAFHPANQPGQPVRIRFQAFDTGNVTRGPWRDLVTSGIPGMPGISGDRPTRFRFQLIFDRSVTTGAVVEEVRVLAR